MAPFDYLVILLSLVLGLAITNLLAGWARLIHGRGTVAVYFPSVVWSVLIFVACIQHWWSDYSVRTVVHWTFAGFFCMLLTPLDLYLLSELVLPTREAAHETMAVWFERNRRWFYVLIFALAPLSYIEEYFLRGSIHKSPLEQFFFVVFAILAATGALLKPRRVQYAIAAVMAALIAMYIILLFSSLPV